MGYRLYEGVVRGRSLLCALALVRELRASLLEPSLLRKFDLGPSKQMLERTCTVSFKLVLRLGCVLGLVNF